MTKTANRFRHKLDTMSQEAKDDVMEYADSLVFSSKISNGKTYKGILILLLKILNGGRLTERNVSLRRTGHRIDITSERQRK